jgi:hypothetical protein
MAGRQSANVSSFNGRSTVLVAKEIEIDVGAQPLDEFETTISDTDVLAGSNIFVAMNWAAPTGKDADDVPMDTYVLAADPQGVAGSFTLRLRSLDGMLHDRYLINYLIA